MMKHFPQTVLSPLQQQLSDWNKELNGDLFPTFGQTKGHALGLGDGRLLPERLNSVWALYKNKIL